MKLKTIQISIENCLKLTHRYITMETLYKDVDPQIYSYTMKKIAPDFMYEVLKIPLIIFLRDEGNVTAKASSEIKGLENLFSLFVLDITYIFNPELLILYRLFLQKSEEKNLSDIQINVIVINDEIAKEVNFDRYQKMKLLMDFISYTNPNSSSLDVDLLEKIYGENELDFFGSTSIKNIFPRKRKASIVKSKSDIENPWLNLYLQPNKTYLSFDNASNPKKEIKLIHCPICAIEHPLKDDLIKIEDNNIHFKCSHENTQFAKYNPFHIPCSFFLPDIVQENDTKYLQKFFKNNVQPVKSNGSYMIQIIKPYDDIEYIPLIKYIHKNIGIAHDRFLPKILSNFCCPICSQSFLINFTDEDQQDYIDIDNNLYTHYAKLFQLNGKRVVFNCTHQGTPFDIYKKFDVKSIPDMNLKDQSILISERYSSNYLDGKKIVTWSLKDKLQIFDMVNYL
ncbi:hypothetical protein Sulku_2703 (plasmid) [Sulfuricurvum kujiense DSM 16994]|uniref:Uncharacterized protein n=2 Tax=Sulfuricurvum kujiense TaxID=148813 RepID=E4U3T7_SULKY|nr:hypothetical protein Sulku_2703 [Sulfuricurvum kujiense DSM 16994]